MVYNVSNPWYGFLLTASPFDAWRTCRCNIRVDWGDAQSTTFDYNSTTQPNNLSLVHYYSQIGALPYTGCIRIANTPVALSTTTVCFQVLERFSIY